jgi:hypothetical protein
LDHKHPFSDKYSRIIDVEEICRKKCQKKSIKILVTSFSLDHFLREANKITNLQADTNDPHSILKHVSAR